MLASVALIAGLQLFGAVPAEDQVVCPPAHRMGEPIPKLWFAPGWPLGFDLQTNVTKTAVTDAIKIALPGAQWFQEYVGGSGNGVYALYDTATNTYVQCGYMDTANFVGAWKVPLAWVPRAVPARAASIQVRTGHGITFGMTPLQVEAVYGKAPLQPYMYGTYLDYDKDQKVRGFSDFGTGTMFYFVDGKLIGIERTAGF